MTEAVPPVSDVAPSDRYLTGYDQQHLVTYLRLLHGFFLFDGNLTPSARYGVTYPLSLVDASARPTISMRLKVAY
jgi:hypothetical protein